MGECVWCSVWLVEGGWWVSVWCSVWLVGGG